MGRAALLMVAALLAACTPGAKSGANAEGEARAGASATDFTLKDADGRTVSLSDFLGKRVILVDFWATWCVPCQAELPLLEDMYEKRKERGLVVLGVAMDGPETVAQVPSYVQRYSLTFPVLLDEETKVVNVYNPKRTAPFSLLIDKSGKIVSTRQGYSAGDETLMANEVDALLGK